MSTVAELLVKIGADPSQFEKAITRTEKSLAKMGKKLTKMGETMTKGLTVPLAGLGVAAFASANDLDEAYATIRAGTGATGEDLEGLKESFKTVFKDVPQDAGEASQALADLNTRTGATGTELEALTKQFLDLGRVSGEDVPTLIKNGTRAFGDWGIEVQDQAKTMDYFWKVSQTTGIGVGDLMNKMVQFGAPLRQMGFGFETSAALLGKFEKEGVNTELVMGSMRQALGKMAKEGIAAEEGLQATIEAVKAAGSTSEANAIALELFGARAGPDMAAAIREGRFGVEELMSTLDASSETITKAGEDTLTFGDKFTQLKNKSQTALEPLGEILLKLAEEWLPKVTGALEKVASWFENLSPKMQKTIVIVGLIVAAIGPLLIGLGFMTTAIAGTLVPMAGAIIKATTLAFRWAFLGTESTRSAIKVVAAWISTAAAAVANTAVMIAQSAVMVAKWVWMGVQSMAQAVRMAAAWVVAMGPIAWVTAAVIAIVALIIANWDKVKEFTVKVWKSVAEFFSELWDGIKGVFKKTFEWLKQLFLDYHPIGLVIKHWETIKKFFGDLWDNVKKTFSNTWDAIKDKTKSAWDSIVSVIRSPANLIIGIANGIIGAFEKMVNFVGSAINKIPSFKIPDWVPGIGGSEFGLPTIPSVNLPRIPQLATGTNHVPKDMFAMLHKGEAVVPKKYNNGLNGTINITVNGQNNPEKTAQEIIRIVRRRTGLVI
jgi:TP901 family phage tail tape measure protein